MAVVKGRNVRVELGATYGSPIAVASLTLANPAVASSVAHGLNNNELGFWSGVTGMEQLNDQVSRVKNKTADTFELQGYNTLGFPAYTAGDFTKVLTWLTLAEATSYEIGGGEAEKLNVTRLIDVIRQEENGLLAAQSIGLDVLAQTVPSACMQLIEASAQQGAKLVMRITHNVDGAVRIAYGEPSFPGESVGQGAVGTGSMQFSVKGYVLKLAA